MRTPSILESAASRSVSRGGGHATHLDVRSWEVHALLGENGAGKRR